MFINVPFPVISGKWTGCLPKPEKQVFASFREAFDIIPKSQWPQYIPTDNKRLKKYQYDQGQEGTCTANALSGCVSYLWSKTYGLENWIAPAPISIYKFCARGPQTGSTLSCCLKRAQTNGMLLIDLPQNRSTLEKLKLNPNHVLKATGYYQTFPEGWEDTAAELKIDEVFEMNTAEEFFTALFNDWDILYGRAGHAIHGVDALMANGEYACDYDNSWGQWGKNGFGTDTLNYLVRQSATYGAYAVRSLRAPTNAEALGVPSLNTSV